MKKRVALFLFIILTVFLCSCRIQLDRSITFHVAVDGNDSNPGTQNEPFASLKKAQEAVRIEAVRGMKGDIIVLLHEGSYTMESKLTFNAKDGGNNGHKVIYRGMAGKKVVLTGAEGNIIEVFGKSMNEIVENMEFENLVVRGCSSADIKGQDDKEFGGNAFFIENAANITIRGCRISDVDGNGIYMHYYATKNLVEGCEISNTGINGIYMRGIYYSGPKSNYNKGNKITNNHIYGIKGGSGIQTVQSSDNIISHNRIHNVGQYCISFKTPRPGTMYNHVIDGVRIDENNGRQFRNSGGNLCEFNDMSDANEHADDTGMVESWAGAPGNIIRNNYFHGKASSGGWVFVVYLDDASEEFTIENNIIAGIPKAGAAVFAKGIGNKIRNNIIVNNRLDTVFLSQTLGGEPNYDLEFERNIVVDSGAKLFTFYNWQADRIKKSDRNLFFASPDTEEYFIDGAESCTNLSEWQEKLGFDTRSIVRQDPLFVDADRGDFRLRYDSPSYLLGFKDFNIQDIGLTSEYPFSDPDEAIDKIFIRKAGEEVNPSYYTLDVGGSIQFDLLARTGTGYVADLSKADIKYTCDHPEIATVDAKGRVTAKKAGVARVTAHISKNNSGKKVEIFILAGDQIERLEIAATKDKVLKGTEAGIEVFAVYSSGRKILLDKGDYKLSETGNCFDIEENSALKARTAGKAELTATYAKNGKSAVGKLVLECVESVFTKLEIIPSGTLIRKNGVITLDIKGYDNEGNEIVIPVEGIKATVGDSSVLHMESPYKFSGLSEGGTKISVEATVNGMTLTQSIDILVEPDEIVLEEGWRLSNYKLSKGYARFNKGRFEIYSTGADVYDVEDDATFVHRTFTGKKFSVSAVVDSFTDIGDKDSALGIMIRDKDDRKSDNVNIRMLPSGEIRLVYRNKENPACNYAEPKGIASLKYPVGLKLERNGKTFAGYVKVNDVWVEVANMEIDMGENVEVGVFEFSHSEGRFVKGEVSDLVIKKQ